MRTTAIIYMKELRSFFLSPFAFVVMALFTFINGWLFISTVNAMRVTTIPYSLVYNVFSSGWFWMGFLFIFPVITMRLFAEEKKTGTFEGLMTAPVRTGEVLIGKYGAAVTVYLAMLAPLLLFFPVFKMVTGQEDAFHSGAQWGSALILILVGIFNIAIGTLASAVTANQLIAAMLTFVGVMLHYFFGFFVGFATLPDSKWAAGMDYVSTVQHVQLLTQGLIDSRPFVYYLTFSALILSVTWHVIESRKWRI
ncbi:MAG: ABC transporter permease [Verrucomicrobiales bacterium]|nr:ABC transporter permease [Verrucomicrobiales bacterium]